MLEKKYRQAETMVAEESKDDYYAGQKPDIKSFDIMTLDLLTNTTAKVTIRTKLLVLMPGAGAQVFDMPSQSYWKLENGAWNWYIPEETKSATPFGKMNSNGGTAGGLDMKGAAPGGIDNPDVGSLLNKITIDRISVVLTAKEPQQVVTISNGLPGPIDLTLDPHGKLIKGITTDVSPLHLEAGEKATVTIRRTGEGKVLDVVPVTAEPFHRVFNIQVRSE